MTLVWKLLRQHVSVPQFVGFFFANLFGMIVILLGYQFYRDVIPVFNSDDSFLKADYLTISKKTGTTATISGEDNTFKEAEIEDFRRQPFVRKLGAFTSAEYKVNVTMYVKETKLLDSEFFFRAFPIRSSAFRFHSGIMRKAAGRCPSSCLSHTSPCIISATRAITRCRASLKAWWEC